jgi:hypothetical protein
MVNLLAKENFKHQTACDEFKVYTKQKSKINSQNRFTSTSGCIFFFVEHMIK